MGGHLVFTEKWGAIWFLPKNGGPFGFNQKMGGHLVLEMRGHLFSKCKNGGPFGYVVLKYLFFP